MSENDMIAEYVKEKYPELLTTCDFAIFKIGVAAREGCRSMCETLKKIDFGVLKDCADRINDRRE